MAGEWIPIDCNLGTKPEVLELVDETGVPVEAVVYRLIQLWSWASMNTADGTIRGTPGRLQAVAGGDEAFWIAVERVGWVSFVNGTIVIQGWEKRFSQAAKARAQAARRQDAYRASRSRNAAPLQGCDGRPSPEEKRGEEKREEIQPAAPVATSEPPKRRARSRPAGGIRWDADAGWQGITDADAAEWRLAYPACDLPAECARATAWLKANPTKAHKSNWRRFLVAWLTRSQDKGGTNREPGNRAGPPPSDPAKRRYYRSDLGRNMTDAEYAAWMRDQRTGGTVTALAQSLRLQEART